MEESPRIGGGYSLTSRGGEEFFLCHTPQPHDTHKEKLQHPISTDSGKIFVPDTTCDKNNQHRGKQQIKARYLELPKDSYSRPPASALDEISEIKSPLGCLDSSSLPSEVSPFSVSQTMIESSYLVGLEGESVDDGDQVYDTKRPEEIRKVKEHNRPQNQVGTATVGMKGASLPTQGQQNLNTYPRQQLPASYHEWIEGIVDIATHVWMPLGLFTFRPNAEFPLDLDHGAAGESTKAVHDSEYGKMFLCCLQDFYSHVVQEGTYPYPGIMRISNGLFQLLFNTVFYCLFLLDLHQCPAYDTKSNPEVNPHGPKNTHGVGCASGSSTGPDRPPSLVPAPLSWTKTTASHSRTDNSRGPREDPRRRWQPNPSVSNRSSLVGDKTPGGVPKVQPRRTHHFCRNDSIHDSLKTSDLNALDESYARWLRVPLSVLDWRLLVRCLAQMGYKRDQFYIQTPTHASPHELLLVMLWLTKQYQLVTVAEYVEINQRYPFLLRYHTATSDSEGSPLLDIALTMNQERLLFSFSKSTVWPPASFDESAIITHRLRQIERILGAERSEKCMPQLVPQQGQHCAGGVEKTVLRRVLSVQNLIQMSLNRLERALQQRNELISSLGPHSYLDAQLCTYENHNLYVRVVEGLSHLLAMEKRVLQRSRSLCAAGLLLSFVISHQDPPTHVTDWDVVESLEGDAATWLANGYDNEQDEVKGYDKTKTIPASLGRLEAVRRGQMRHTTLSQASANEEGDRNTELLSHTISQFRAARIKEHLGSMWKSMVRRAKIHASPEDSTSNSLCCDGSTVLLSDEAQAKIELHVKHHIDRYYSLHAALAAELLIFQCQHQQQIHSSQDRNPLDDSHSSTYGSSFFGNQSSTVQPYRGGNGTSPLPLNSSGVPLAVPLLFTTTTSTLPSDISGATDSTYKGTPLGDYDIQPVEIGDPGPGATTSAIIEFERISRILEETIQESKNQRDERVAFCRESLNHLRRVYNLRMLTKIDQG
ncbi:unnamed protein product [Phytomonas sp. EM1]|nr:unnamed protein product [Phytomonas sp. EM1]|eukprot:CCW62997.1 unnamed protein product [Phytomonas sp. isolate EM1]